MIRCVEIDDVLDFIASMTLLLSSLSILLRTPISPFVSPCVFFFFMFSHCDRTHAAAHDPPLKLYGIPARYANATYSAASKAGELEIVQRDLDAFQHVRKPSGRFLSCLCIDSIVGLVGCMLMWTWMWTDLDTLQCARKSSALSSVSIRWRCLKLNSAL